jgi:hypothetical protein
MTTKEKYWILFVVNLFCAINLARWNNWWSQLIGFLNYLAAVGCLIWIIEKQKTSPKEEVSDD